MRLGCASHRLLREGFNKKTKKYGYIHIWVWPTHPPNMDKTKKDMLFFGLLAHLEQKFLIFIHLATHHCHPLDHQLLPPHPHQPLMYPTAATHNGGWLQWWMALVVGGSSGCYRLAVEDGVGGSDVCWWQQWWWVAIADVGIGCCLTQCLVWPTPPPKKEKKGWSKMT